MTDSAAATDVNDDINALTDAIHQGQGESTIARLEDKLKTDQEVFELLDPQQAANVAVNVSKAMLQGDAYVQNGASGAGTDLVSNNTAAAPVSVPTQTQPSVTHPLELGLRADDAVPTINVVANSTPELLNQVVQPVQGASTTVNLMAQVNNALAPPVEPASPAQSIEVKIDHKQDGAGPDMVMGKDVMGGAVVAPDPDHQASATPAPKPADDQPKIIMGSV